MKSPFVSLVSDKKIPLLVELSNLQAFLSSHSTKNLKPLEESFRQTSLGEIPLYQELCMLQESLIDIQTRLIEAKESITKVEELKREMEVELGNCPTCGRSFDNVE
jgi:DNA repair exonuclease SbcCD ATPase subunit